MKLNEGRGIKTQRWDQNGMFRYDDANAIGLNQYQNTTDLLALLSSQSVLNEVLSGLDLVPSFGMGCTLRSGVAVSFDGQYLSGDSWGFVAESGALFSVVIPENVSAVFDSGTGMLNPRIDTLEVRPTQVPYDPQPRAFKDPVVKTVSSVTVNTRIEYGFEVQILKGTESVSPVAPASTAGWIKVAEVSVGVDMLAITASQISTFKDAVNWTQDISSVVWRYQSSPTDSTAGRLIENGGHGIGGYIATEDSNANNLVTPGIYTLGAVAVNAPVAVASVVVVGGYQSDRITQMAITVESVPRSFFRAYTGTWSAWVESYNSANHPEVFTSTLEPTVGDGEDGDLWFVYEV